MLRTMQQNKQLDIAIIGCGTAGSAAALLLKKQGHRVCIFEALQNFEPVGAGLLIQPVGLAVLKQLGIYQQCIDHGSKITRLWGCNEKNKTILDLHYPHLHKFIPPELRLGDHADDYFGLGLHRNVLQASLIEAVQQAKIPIHWDTTIDNIEFIQQQAKLRAQQQQLGPFDLVIIANGGRSQLVNKLSIKRKVVTYPWGAIWAIVSGDAKQPNCLSQVYRDCEIMAGILPSGRLYHEQQQTVSLFWSLANNNYPAWRSAGLDAWKKQVLQYMPDTSALLDQIQSIDQLAFANYRDVIMPRYHQQCAVVIGDAAHAMSPQLGQGANLALVDAFYLSKHIANNTNIAESLKNYSKQHRPQIRYYQLSSRMVTPLFQSHSKLLARMRDFIYPYLHRLPLSYRLMLSTLACYKKGLSGYSSIAMEIQSKKPTI